MLHRCCKKVGPQKHEVLTKSITQNIITALSIIRLSITKRGEKLATADQSIAPRLMQSAKKHFLQHGFQNSSLKEICRDAGITTGAIYNRFKGKEELFDALVEDTVRDLFAEAERRGDVDLTSISDEDLLKAWDMDEEAMMEWFDFLYQRYDGFMLLLCSSEGTKWSNFEHDWVAKMNQYTVSFLEEAQKRGLVDRTITRSELHVLLSSFWTTIYEPFIHNFDQKDILLHCQIICRLFDWHRAIGFKTEP